MAMHNRAPLDRAEAGDAPGGHPASDLPERAAGQSAGARSQSRGLRSLGRRLERGLLHPIDHLRRRMTRGLRVGASDRPVRRGEQLDARVTISRPEGLGQVEVLP